MRKTIFIFLFFILIGIPVIAQNYYVWWDKYHNWDGKTPQLNYIKRSPNFMGPNALPVPQFRGTKIGYRSYFNVGADYYFSKQETTVNPYFHLYFPMQKNRIAFEMYTRPIEFYKTSIAIRDKRFMRDSVPEGFNKGDTYFATRVRIWEHLFWLPDLTLESTLKTTTGKNLENARHTNAPAYIFNGVLGNYFYGSDTSKNNIRWHVTLGTYIWQANDNIQNDAFLYGAGIESKYYKWNFNINGGGYSGYRKNGDKPIIARASVQYNTKNFDFRMQYQRGIQNYITNSIHISCSYKINYFDKWNKY